MKINFNNGYSNQYYNQTNNNPSFGAVVVIKGKNTNKVEARIDALIKETLKIDPKIKTFTYMLDDEIIHKGNHNIKLKRMALATGSDAERLENRSINFKNEGPRKVFLPFEKSSDTIFKSAEDLFHDLKRNVLQTLKDLKIIN